MGPMANPSGAQDPAKPATAPCSSAETARDAPAMNAGPARPMPSPWIIIATVSARRVSNSAIIENATMSRGRAPRSSVNGASSRRCTITAWEKSEQPADSIMAMPNCWAVSAALSPRASWKRKPMVCCTSAMPVYMVTPTTMKGRIRASV